MDRIATLSLRVGAVALWLTVARLAFLVVVSPPG